MNGGEVGRCLHHKRPDVRLLCGAAVAQPFELDLDVFRTEGARHAWGGGNAHVDAS
jgi:hypothetical protein